LVINGLSQVEEAVREVEEAAREVEEKLSQWKRPSERWKRPPERWKRCSARLASWLRSRTTRCSDWAVIWPAREEFSPDKILHHKFKEKTK
jgi:hypothetical protein